MENILKMVISIDQKADDIMKNTQQYLETREKDIKGKIDAMRTEIMDKTRDEAKVLYDSIIAEAEVEAAKIRESTKSDCSDLESKFLKIREKLENQLFSRIFN